MAFISNSLSLRSLISRKNHQNESWMISEWIGASVSSARHRFEIGVFFKIFKNQTVYCRKQSNAYIGVLELFNDPLE